MMLDKELIFSEAQGPFNTGTNASTNVLDRLVDSDWGKGSVMWLYITVTELMAGGSLDIQLVTDDEPTFTGPTVLWSSGVLAAASFPAGTVFRIRVPSGVKQYTRVNYVQTSANQTTGKFWAVLVKDVDDYKVYPRADYKVA